VTLPKGPSVQTKSNSFSGEIINQLDKAKLNYSGFESFATPRRLAILIKDLETKQQDKVIDRKGPALKAAFDAEGNASKAAQGFARSCGVTVAELKQVETEKGAWLSYSLKEKGQESAVIIPEIIRSSHR